MAVSIPGTHIPVPPSCNNHFNASSFPADLNSPVKEDRILAAESLVQSCPQICPLVYGSGNPDISGIGVLISYLMQMGYISLFGAVFSIACLLLPQHHKNSLAIVRLRAISRATMGTSTLLTFTSLIATYIRMKQNPPPYEIIFLNELRMYLGKTCNFTIWMHLSLYFSSIKIENRDNFVVLCDQINAMLAWLVHPAVSDKGSVDLSKSAILQVCTTVEDFPMPTKDSREVDGATKRAILVITIPITFLIGILIAKFWPLLRKPLDRPAIKATCRSLLVFILLLINLTWIAFLTTSGYSMIRVRKHMLEVNQAANDDNQWGFGQITAVMLWLPLNLLVFFNFLRVLLWKTLLLMLFGLMNPHLSEQDEERALNRLLWIAFFPTAFWLYIVPRDPEEDRWCESQLREEERQRKNDEESTVETSEASAPPANGTSTTNNPARNASTQSVELVDINEGCQPTNASGSSPYLNDTQQSE